MQRALKMSQNVDIVSSGAWYYDIKKLKYGGWRGVR